MNTYHLLQRGPEYSGAKLLRQQGKRQFSGTNPMFFLPAGNLAESPTPAGGYIFIRGSNRVGLFRLDRSFYRGQFAFRLATGSDFLHDFSIL